MLLKFLAVLLLVASPILGAQTTAAQVARTPAAAPMAERPVALIIGNDDYKDSPLVNPVNDARDLAGTLEELGFKVTRLENANLGQMVKAMREFGDRLQQGGVGLF